MMTGLAVCHASNGGCSNVERARAACLAVPHICARCCCSSAPPSSCSLYCYMPCVIPAAFLLTCHLVSYCSPSSLTITRQAASGVTPGQSASDRGSISVLP
eukprot:GHRQ01011025.1.p1 GENE.GHRQ01011025.1~~GHRQ01011025.1.p1  ORF type:complete len:101 (-),score=8.03 GHRQ01011025.1:674-976(-)